MHLSPRDLHARRESCRKSIEPWSKFRHLHASDRPASVHWHPRERSPHPEASKSRQLPFHSQAQTVIMYTMRSFCTEGPVDPDHHYSIPPLERLDLDEVLGLIRERRYFVLHAPRQTGKTSALLALQDLLNSGAEGDFRCVYVSFEAAQGMDADAFQAMRTLISGLGREASLAIDDPFVADEGMAILERVGAGDVFTELLHQWARRDRRPLVLLVDEIDSLIGKTLLSIFKQLRTGYRMRPKSFPQSIVLCGLRDIRDYRISSDSSEDPASSGSPFNIIARSLRLGDFSLEETSALATQHTSDTGQEFTSQAARLLWTRTRGQPWLVNALCQQACFRSKTGRDRSRPITEEDIREAQERLILERAIHIHSLAERLREDRVRRVIEPMLTGSDRTHFTFPDLEYVRDLGLVTRDDPPKLANPIYAEVLPRELTAATQSSLLQDSAWYVDGTGRLDMHSLLEAFQQFFREHSEFWIERFGYKEAGPHLLLQAFLQRVVNGGGRVEREYGLGRKRTDLLVTWPAKPKTQRIVVECKLVWAGLDSTIKKGVTQTAKYIDLAGAEEGHLVVFGRRDRSWSERVFRRTEMIGELTITVWGM